MQETNGNFREEIKILEINKQTKIEQNPGCQQQSRFFTAKLNMMNADPDEIVYKDR